MGAPRRLAGLMLAVGLGGLAGGIVRDGMSTAASSGAADRLWALVLTDSAGHPASLALWRGRPVLVNFWAGWCPPCREEMPLLAGLVRQIPSGGLQVVGIAWDSPSNLGEWEKQNPPAYPSLAGSAGIRAAMRGLGNVSGGLPFSVLVDAQGRLLASHPGAFRDADALRQWLDHSEPNGHERW